MSVLAETKTAGSAPGMEHSGDGESAVRALTAAEIDDVAGGGLLFLIGGLAAMGLIYVDYGEEIGDALAELEEWLKGD